MNTTSAIELPALLTWDNDDNYEEFTHEFRDNGTIYRAVVMRDSYPDAPDGDIYPFILRTDWRGQIELASAPYGQSGAGEELARAYNELGGELFARYARIFHGASIHEFRSTVDRSGDEYVAIVTDELWTQVWGNDRLMPSDAAQDGAADWQAYLDGNVYGARIERMTGRSEDGEPIWASVDGEPECWGLFGDDYAVQYAADELAYIIARDATEILPLEF